MNNAYITLLSTNSYIYGCVELILSWKRTNPKYPFICVVTPNITQYNKELLKTLGYIVKEENLLIPIRYYDTLKDIEAGKIQLSKGESTADLSKDGWQYAWNKLYIFKYTEYDKLIYLDADTYIWQNMDDLFDLPDNSFVPEVHSYKLKRPHRFLSAFLVIKPSLKDFEGLIQCAEDNAIIDHPYMGRSLAADLDILNIYFDSWKEDYNRHVSTAVYVDSMLFEEHSTLVPFWKNHLMKVKAIHLTGKKPWIGGTEYANTLQTPWIFWKELYLWYIKILNDDLTELYDKGIAELPLIK